MAYSRFINGFEITSNAAIDKRLLLTKEQMINAESLFEMPDKYFCLCVDDGQVYVYDSTSSSTSTEGKFVKASKEVKEEILDYLEDEGYIKESGLPAAITSVMQSQPEAMEQAVSKALPGALEDTMQAEGGAERIANALFDSEQFDVNVDKKIELKLDDAIQLIQAIDSN